MKYESTEWLGATGRWQAMRAVEGREWVLVGLVGMFIGLEEDPMLCVGLALRKLFEGEGGGGGATKGLPAGAVAVEARGVRR